MNPHDMLFSRLEKRITTSIPGCDLDKLYRIAKLLYGPDDSDVAALRRAMGGDPDAPLHQPG